MVDVHQKEGTPRRMDLDEVSAYMPLLTSFTLMHNYSTVRHSASVRQHRA